MIKAILLDIEGTTTPIDFVHKTLFPYAKARIASFVEEHFDELRIEIAELADERLNEPEYSAPLYVDSPNSIAGYLEYLITEDRKSTPLKSVQGIIWQKGYESGELQSTVFDDVPLAMKRWKDDGKTIASYSSGSVLAQELIFKYSDHGDLTKFIDRYFDTNIGHKRESESYSKIALALNLEIGEILFVSDTLAELDSAREAGMRTTLSIRKGNAAITENAEHATIRSLVDVNI